MACVDYKARRQDTMYDTKKKGNMCLTIKTNAYFINNYTTKVLHNLDCKMTKVVYSKMHVFWGYVYGV